MMQRRIPLLRMVVLVGLSVGLCSACSPQPDAETAALEQHLLSVDDVGDGFTQERGGQVSYVYGHLCPETEASVSDVGAVKAWFVKPTGGGEISVVEHLWTGSPEVLDEQWASLTTAFADCDGAEWDYFGEMTMIKIVDAPVVGDDRIAVRRTDPTGDEVSDGYTVFVRDGDVIAVVDVPDSSEASSDIIRTAIDKLPD